MKVQRLLVAVLATTMILAACGGSDDESSDADPALVAAIADSIGDEDSPFDRDTSECAAEKIIDQIGLARLGELGVTADDVREVDEIAFNDGEIDSIVASIGDCSDLSDLMADSLAADGVIPTDKAECFGNEVDDSVIEDVFRLILRDSDAEPTQDFQNAFLEAILECEIPLG